MTRNFLHEAAALWMSALFATSAGATILHDEGVDGDISNDRLNPTDHMLAFGTNSVIATSVSGDREYLTLTVPAGMQLDSVVLFSYTSVDPLSFIAVQSGTTLTEPPTGTDPSNLLGWTHFGPGAGNVGTDILDDLGASAPAIGFSPPLGPGDYTWWMQQTGVNAATFQFDFNVSPEPATLGLVALVALGLRRRR
jgi:hypothetical protein